MDFWKKNYENKRSEVGNPAESIYRSFKSSN